MTRELRRAADAVDLVPAGADIVVPLANGEPVSLIAALDQHADRLTDVTVHQMHALHDHPYLHGARRPHLSHRSYFLSHVTRPACATGGCDLVPSHFSEVPLLLRERIPDGATIQAGIGSIPDAVVRLLMGHRDLGIHTELLSDGLVSLVEAGVELRGRSVRERARALIAIAPPEHRDRLTAEAAALGYL